jgi:3-oxoacyl-[acyl-carrier protein] reductase
MDLGLAGRRAIVLGSTRGLGYACAEALVGEGVTVTVNGRDSERAQAAADRLRALGGGRVETVVGDIIRADTRAELLTACPEPDILVTNAGGPPPGPLRDATAEDWTLGLNTNLFAHLAMVEGVADGMCKRRFGRIVNITSAMVTTPRPTMAVSSGVRSALTAVLKGLSFELARYNVTINNLLPERFDTERQQQMARVASARDGVTFDEARRRQVESIAARRMGRPEELGATCAFVCSELAGFMSGQNIRLDGGSYPGLV